MEDQINQIIQNKILASVEAGMPVLTRRDATLPPLKGKAAAVIGMRRAGKTSFLHQCRPTEELFPSRIEADGAAVRREDLDTQRALLEEQVPAQLACRGKKV
jgi:predicted AAA+ superfamily ATPase